MESVSLNLIASKLNIAISKMENHYCGLEVWGFDAVLDEDGLV